MWGKIFRWFIFRYSRRLLYVSFIVQIPAVIFKLLLRHLLPIFSLIVQGTAIINELFLDQWRGRGDFLSLLAGGEDVGEEEHEESEDDAGGTALDEGEVVSIETGLVSRLALPVETATTRAAVDVEVAIVFINEAGDG